MHRIPFTSDPAVRGPARNCRAAPQPRLQADNPRAGAALVIALICLLLVGMLAATLARSAVVQHEQVVQEEWQIQAEWLAESALERARARLAADPDYSGEEWLPASSDSGLPIGRVLIELEGIDASQAGARTLRVVADVPNAPHRRARVSLETSMSFSTESAVSIPN